MKKIAIVGAGPAGLFAAYKLDGRCDVTIYERGRNIEERVCHNNAKGKCVNCRPCNLVCGVGGAGLFSDGKLIFDETIGNNLSEIAREKNAGLVADVEEIFRQYGIETEVKNEAEVKRIQKLARQHGMDFAYGRQAHIGSTNLIALITKIRSDLAERGVKFVSSKNISALKDIEFDSVLLAPGRSGSTWLEQILKQNNIDYGFRPVDIGVRIEVPEEITEDITRFTRDMKFYITTDTYQDRARTFCTCPQGLVAKEIYDKFVLVNGHSDSHRKTHNTNFALIVTIPLTEPLVNTNLYAHNLARVFDDLGDKKPIMQRLGDLKRNRRSRQENDSKYRLAPTLTDATYGDISLAMPARYLTDLVEAIEKLDGIMPGLANDSTILYAPEMKFHGLKILTDEYSRAAERIYVAGDGAGLSRGIVGAAASGLLAAEGILNE